MCCSVKTNKGRLVRRAAGGCGEGFGACKSGRRCAGVCTRVSKNQGEFLLKQTPGGERVVGASGGDAVAAVGYREVVKREFARESSPPLGPRWVSEGLRPSVYIGPETDPSQNEALLIFLYNEEDISRFNSMKGGSLRMNNFIRRNKKIKDLLVCDIKVERKKCYTC